MSMGLGPMMAIYQARFNRYLEDRGLKPASDAKVWAFLAEMSLLPAKRGVPQDGAQGSKPWASVSSTWKTAITAGVHADQHGQDLNPVHRHVQRTSALLKDINDTQSIILPEFEAKPVAARP